MKAITGITSVTVDSPSAGYVTIVAPYVTNQTFTQPVKCQTVPEYPANPNWSRGHRITDAAYFILRNGANTVAMLLDALAAIGVALEPSLSWAPLIATQPTAQTATFKGTLTGSGTTNVSDGDTVTIGSVTYRFKTVMAQVNDIQIAGSGNSDTSLNNLIDAINGTGTAGTNWYAGTVASVTVTAGALAAHAFTVSAIGTTANIASTKSSSVLSWGASTLAATASFAVVAGLTETPITYQWQYSTNAGVTWSNATGTVSGCTYSNGTTATLTCVPTTLGQTGALHRCVVTNSSGSTNTNAVALTIV